MDARLIPNRRPHRATTSTSRRQRGTREGGPARSWRVGSLESVKTHNRWLMTATAFVPVERLEPWQSFGPNGQRVVRILERIERFDANDLVRLRLRLNDVNRDPIDSARVEVPMGAASPFQEVRSRVVAAAESLDPAAVVGRAWESGYQGDPRSLESPIWGNFLVVATEAATALFMDIESEPTTLLERRFWKLVAPT
jgi:hypothetical protein